MVNNDRVLPDSQDVNSNSWDTSNFWTNGIVSDDSELTIVIYNFFSCTGLLCNIFFHRFTSFAAMLILAICPSASWISTSIS